ncbi:MAG: BatA domain-containing protein [Deltaproteobacteria bacterium]|nr:BatA domain-containing protein [Deltaproteobacteria bacterium]
MSFLSPALLFGLALIGVPIAIHLIGRKRAPVLMFSAYDFLEEVVQRLARREQLRQLLLLLLRIAIVALLAFGLAGPGLKSLVAPVAVSDTLIVLDASHSMSYRLGSSTLLARAKKKAEAILRDRSQGLALVVVADTEPRPLAAQPNADRTALIGALEDVTPGPRGGDLASAVKRGLELFGEGSVDLFLISDLSENAFGAGDALASTKVHAVTLVDAADRDDPPRALANVGLGPLVHEHLSDGGERVIVTARNFGAAPASGELRLTLDGQVRARAFIELPPGAVSEREFTLTELADGLHPGDVTIAAEGDGYADDDTAPLAIERFAEPRVLVVNGDPKSVSFRDEIFYLERALQVAKPEVAFDVVAADDLSTQRLDAHKVLVLANVPAPAASVGQEIADFVKKGGGLLITLGDRVSFEAYNEVFGAILPARLRDQWAVADPKAHDVLASALGLTDIAWQHPVFRRFDPVSEPAFTQSHTFRHFFVEAQDLNKTRQLMRFSSGAPALLERAAAPNEGRVLMWLSTIDRDFSDLAIRPVFAPLAAQMLRYVGGTLRSAPDRAYVAGVPGELVLPAGVSRAHVVALGQTKKPSPPIAVDASNPTASLPAPGHYALAASEGGPPIIGTATSAIASLEESSFQPVSREELAKRWAAGDVAVLAASAKTPGAPSDFRGYAHLILLALVLVFSVQSLLASRG